MNEIMNTILALAWMLALLISLAKKKPTFDMPEDDKGTPISWLKIPVGQHILIAIDQMTFSHIGTFREHGYHLPDRADDTDLAALVELRSEVLPNHEGGVRGLQFMALQGALVTDLLRFCYLEKWTLGGDDDSDTYPVPEGVTIRIDHLESQGARTRYQATMEGGA